MIRDAIRSQLELAIDQSFPETALSDFATERHLSARKSQDVTPNVRVRAVSNCVIDSDTKFP